VLSVLIYDCENRTLTTKTTKNLEAEEMWSSRRILFIPWTHTKLM